MKQHRWLLVALALAVALFVAHAATSPAPAKDKPASKETKPPPGVEAAQALSTITGVAISPLLGVSAVGAWKYYHTAAERRDKLPWFAQPWFWSAGLLLVGVVALKDAFGTTVPVVLKKPLDVAEAIENKISGLVAAGAFVPLVAAIFESVKTDASLSSLGFATVDFSPLLNALMVPIALAAFGVVWLVSHAVHMLILISPFATVDAALKAFRAFLLSTVAITSFVNPYVGAAWALVLILICWFLSGWAFRLMICGSMFIWDFATFRRTRFTPDATVNKMFLARETQKVPIRTYGRLARDAQGQFAFTYRPWLVLPARTLTLPDANYAVGRGLIQSEIVRVEGNDTTAVFTLPPRYRSHEVELAKVYGFGEVMDIGLLKGLKAIARFFRELFGFTPKPSAA
ncbi:MAG: hypothetical protein HY300_17205 [Verrucomicrobia bacterium]|nr:hypothetical protein [Verrucomicrobiota bacterium]